MSPVQRMPLYPSLKRGFIQKSLNYIQNIITCAVNVHSSLFVWPSKPQHIRHLKVLFSSVSRGLKFHKVEKTYFFVYTLLTFDYDSITCCKVLADIATNGFLLHLRQTKLHYTTHQNLALIQEMIHNMTSSLYHQSHEERVFLEQLICDCLSAQSSLPAASNLMLFCSVLLHLLGTDFL